MSFSEPLDGSYAFPLLQDGGCAGGRCAADGRARRFPQVRPQIRDTEKTAADRRTEARGHRGTGSQAGASVAHQSLRDFCPRIATGSVTAVDDDGDSISHDDVAQVQIAVTQPLAVRQGATTPQGPRRIRPAESTCRCESEPR